MASDTQEILPLLLTQQQVAALCNVSVKTLARWARDRRVPRPIKFGDSRAGAVRYRRTDIESWVTAGCPSVIQDSVPAEDWLSGFAPSDPRG